MRGKKNTTQSHSLTPDKTTLCIKEHAEPRSVPNTAVSRNDGDSRFFDWETDCPVFEFLAKHTPLECMRLALKRGECDPQSNIPPEHMRSCYGRIRAWKTLP